MSEASTTQAPAKPVKLLRDYHITFETDYGQQNQVKKLLIQSGTRLLAFLFVTAFVARLMTFLIYGFLSIDRMDRRFFVIILKLPFLLIIYLELVCAATAFFTFLRIVTKYFCKNDKVNNTLVKVEKIAVGLPDYVKKFANSEECPKSLRPGFKYLYLYAYAIVMENADKISGMICKQVIH